MKVSENLDNIEDLELNSPITPADIADNLSIDDTFNLIVYLDRMSSDWELTKSLHKYFKGEVKKQKEIMK